MASLVETQGYAGDEGNFEALYSTYRSDVQRLASYLLKNAADAEDASQTVFMNVLRALRQGVRPAEPRAWLMAITRNVCFSRRRAVSCRPVEVELDPERASEAADADMPRIDDIVGALSRMLPNQRTALILRDFRGASHGEICELLAMSPAGVETLLTRARTSFREEIEAGDQPFDCDETKALVEQQLAGKITVAERHSLRTHLRHCGPCSTLARAVRSSKGKLAGFFFWPVELFQRLASALSQAPSVAHVAVAVTSTAAVAAVAIPVAITHVSASSNHVEGRTAPGLAAASASHEPAASHAVGLSATSVAAHSSHVRTHVTRQARAAKATKTAKAHAAARAAAGASVALAAAAPVTQAAAPSSAGTTTAPVSSTVHQVSPHAAVSPLAVQQPVAAPPRSPSPAVKPAKSSGHPRKPAARHKPVAGRHPTDPATKPPAGSDPLASLPTPTTSGPATNSGGVTMGSDSTNTTTQSTAPSSSSSSSSQSSTGQSSSTTNSGGSNGNGGGNDDHSHKKPKHGH